jgi:ABC-type multidrug transport system fused ATPase/permease subunit
VLGLYAFAALRIKPAVQYVYQGFASLRYGQKAVDNLYADMHPDNAPEPFPEQAPKALKAKSLISLKHLSYTYPKATKSALSDLNLDIPVGSSVGLVGSTGAGKTTVVDVILGLLRPTKGAITVDGNPVTDEQLRAWQKSLGYVPQDIFLTDTSVAENIALGIPKTQIDQDQVQRCARMAQVHEFISNELPNQYETLVGERGVRLSGGQRQRIGIARALYHNPEVLVFDEATSALDTVTERAVMEAIDALAHQKTIIIIAHRLSTVRNCDQIVLLEKGQIKAKGRFEELVQADKQFREMAVNP